jgi:hypothetical protein
VGVCTHRDGGVAAPAWNQTAPRLGDQEPASLAGQTENHQSVPESAERLGHGFLWLDAVPRALDAAFLVDQEG